MSEHDLINLIVSHAFAWFGLIVYIALISLEKFKLTFYQQGETV